MQPVVSKLARRMSRFRDLSNRTTPVKSARHLPASEPLVPRRLSSDLCFKDQRVWDVDVEMSLRGDPEMYAPDSPETRRRRRAARPPAIPLAKRSRDVTNVAPAATSSPAAAGCESATYISQQHAPAAGDGLGSDPEHRAEPRRSQVHSVTETKGAIGGHAHDFRHRHVDGSTPNSRDRARQVVSPDRPAPEPAPGAKSAEMPLAPEDSEDSEEPVGAHQPSRPTAKTPPSVASSTAVKAADKRTKRRRRRGFGCCSSTAAREGDVKRTGGEEPAIR